MQAMAGVHTFSQGRDLKVQKTIITQGETCFLLLSVGDFKKADLAMALLRQDLSDIVTRVLPLVGHL